MRLHSCAIALLFAIACGSQPKEVVKSAEPVSSVGADSNANIFIQACFLIKDEPNWNDAYMLITYTHDQHEITGVTSGGFTGHEGVRCMTTDIPRTSTSVYVHLRTDAKENITPSAIRTADRADTPINVAQCEIGPFVPKKGYEVTSTCMGRPIDAGLPPEDPSYEPPMTKLMYVQAVDMSTGYCVKRYGKKCSIFATVEPPTLTVPCWDALLKLDFHRVAPNLNTFINLTVSKSYDLPIAQACAEPVHYGLGALKD